MTHLIRNIAVQIILSFILLNISLSAFATPITLQQKIEAIANQFPGKVGIYAENLATQEKVLINADTIFPMASTYKIPIMLQVYKDYDTGKLNLNHTHQVTRNPEYIHGSGILKHLSRTLKPSTFDLTYLMITLSDNIATDMLLSIVKPERVTKTLKNLGLNHTRVDRSTLQMLSDLHTLGTQHFLKDKQDTTTPREMGQLLKLIVTQQAASEEATRQMLKILTFQKFNGRLPRYLNNTTIAHKTGSTHLITNDVGIVRLPNQQDIIICVFSIKNHSQTPTYVAEAMIGKIAKTIVWG